MLKTKYGGHTDAWTAWVTMSLLELLIAAKKEFKSKLLTDKWSIKELSDDIDARATPWNNWFSSFLSTYGCSITSNPKLGGIVCQWEVTLKLIQSEASTFSACNQWKCTSSYRLKRHCQSTDDFKSNNIFNYSIVSMSAPGIPKFSDNEHHVQSEST